MASHYLIDYENVREAGVNYCHRAVEGDAVYLIYTSNASKIGLDALAGMRAEVKVIKVAAGKQSLDMHLISLLGYLVHKHGTEDRYIVVSKDTGYDSVLRYWTAEGYKTERITGTREAQASQSAQVADEAGGTDPSDSSHEEGTGSAPAQNTSASGSRSRRSRRSRSSAAKKTGQKTDTANDSETSNGSGIIMTDAETVSETVIETATETVTETATETVTETGTEADILTSDAGTKTEKEQPKGTKTKKRSQNKNRSNGQPQGEMPNQKQEQTAQHGDKQAQPTPGELRKRLNGRLLSILSKEKVDIKTAGQIASLAVKNVDAKNSKQLIYRSLLQKFGQKQGLTYYGLIKAEL